VTHEAMAAIDPVDGHLEVTTGGPSSFARPPACFAWRIAKEVCGGG
jgi:hypothetical protein